MTKADGTAVTFAYDNKGLRLSKTVGETTQRYTYNGGNLVQIVDGEEYHYIRYDDKGQAITFSYGAASYYLVYNAQGDVVAIAKRDGTIVVEYTYDAWGNILSVTGSMAETLGRKNPFRYRGYFYDEETGLYYLKSRYYDPKVGRFICADGGIKTDGETVNESNIFAYCANSPICNIDRNGKWTFSILAGLDVTLLAFGVSVSIGVTFDDDGNSAVQWSYALPGYINNNQTNYVGLADAGGNVSVQWTNDDQIYQLEGVGTSIGGSIGGIGLDIVYSGKTINKPTDRDAQPSGFQVSAGVGIGGDIHIRQSNAWTIWDNR